MTDKIQTVTGFINKDFLKIVDCHIHFLFTLSPDLRSVNYDNSRTINVSANKVTGNFDQDKGPVRIESSSGELKTFFKRELFRFLSAGGNGLVDCTPYGCGRDGKMLSKLSAETGVNIVAVTGFHKDIFYKQDSEIWKLKSDDAADFFINEIKDSLFECRTISSKNSGITATRNSKRAGVIKLAYNRKLYGKYLELSEAVVNASLETGAPLLVHTDQGINVEELVTFLEKSGINPENVLLSHMDKRVDFGLHRSLAQSGYFLEYDTFLREKYFPEKNLWPLLEKMAKEGYGNKVIAATDIANSLLWKETARSECGLAGFFQKIASRLRSLEVAEDTISMIIGGNAADFLCLKERKHKNSGTKI